MHYKVLTEIVLLNVVLLPVESNRSYNNNCIVIIDTVDVKVVTAAHHHHCKSNCSIMTAFFLIVNHTIASKYVSNPVKPLPLLFSPCEILTLLA